MPAMPMANSVSPSRQGRPKLSVMMTGTDDASAFLESASKIGRGAVGVFRKQSACPPPLTLETSTPLLAQRKPWLCFGDEYAVLAADDGAAFAQRQFDDAGIEGILFCPRDGFCGRFDRASDRPCGLRTWRRFCVSRRGCRRIVIGDGVGGVLRAVCRRGNLRGGFRRRTGSGSGGVHGAELASFAPSGLENVPMLTYAWHRGLHSCAALRLVPAGRGGFRHETILRVPHTLAHSPLRGWTGESPVPTRAVPTGAVLAREYSRAQR